MKIVYFGILVFFLAQQKANGAAVRKQPAFAKPVYSNSYLPAAMQVIFHAVDQLKHMKAEEADEANNIPTTMSVPTTSPHAPGQHQPAPNEASMQPTESTASEESTASIPYEASTISEASTASIASSDSTASTASIASTDSTASTQLFMAVADEAESSVTTQQDTEEIIEKKTEVAQAVTVVLEAETPEENYGTPETNHEIQEAVQETAESNQEVSEKIEDEEATGVTGGSEVAEVPTTTEEKAQEHSDDSSEEVEGDQSSSEESKEESNESKSLGSSASKSDESQSAEEEDDEIRFTLIGEKVAQVPRPSLCSYLRKTAKAPLRGSVQELASLYDALSKDARKQGLAKYSGYSDEVLKALETTMEGGVGPQLRTLLEKAVERNELTRDDTKIKLSHTLNELSDPATILSRDLRRLVPLRYVP